jgi:broad specificity phosphatase PhoE
MRTLYLVRHAETAWNVAARYQGQTDIPLNEVGRSQAAVLRERLRHRSLLFDAAVSTVVTSDLRRAVESAEIAFAAPGREFHLEPRLRELSYGIFEGLTRDEIRAKHPEDFEKWNRDRTFVVPGSEARTAARARALDAVTHWLDRSMHEHLVVMTHGGILRQLLLHTFDDGEMPTHVSFSNLCVHTVHVEEGRWVYAGALL